MALKFAAPQREELLHYKLHGGINDFVTLQRHL